MKISDLKIGKYVVVNDLGSSKYSSGMRVIGKVVEIDNKGNYAIVESLPKHRYEITDFNDFELWAKEIENKTESMSNSEGLSGFTVDKKLLEEAKEKGIDELRKRINQSNDVQQRKRNLGFENVKIPNSNKTVRWKDNGNLEVQSSYELDIPDYILQDEKPDVIGYLNKQIKCKENNDFVEEIIKNYNPIVAYYVGKSIDNLRENEIDNARDLLNKAFKHWE